VIGDEQMKRTKYECVDVYDPITQRVESVVRPKRATRAVHQLDVRDCPHGPIATCWRCRPAVAKTAVNTRG
jgi:hypothetical protein